MLFLVRFLGFLFAHLPEWMVKRIAILLADLFWFFAPGRRRIVLSNLRIAFPEKNRNWVLSIGRESVRQTIEFGLLALALPFFSERRLRKVFSVSDEAEKLIQKEKDAKRPAVLVGPHLGPQEGHALLPFFFPDIPSLGGIYRPLDNRQIDEWIQRTRERFGARLFSRKRGLQDGIRLLRENGWLGIFFDQNSTGNGALITFFDRVASATELPAILAARHDAVILYFYTARIRFWRIEIRGDAGPETSDRETVTIEINHWLEQLLKSDESLVPNWLWLHNRWRHQRPPEFSLRSKKNLLERQNAFLGRSEMPRKEPFFVHLPENLNEFVRLLPLLWALRRSRPDVAISAIGREDFLSFLTRFELSEEAIPVLENGRRERARFRRKLRERYPSAHLVFSRSSAADRDVKAIGALHRFGIVFSGEKRPVLNRVWKPPAEFESGFYPFQLFEQFFRYFRLKGEIDRSPFRIGSKEIDSIGVFFGDSGEEKSDWIERLFEFRKEDSIRIFGLADRRWRMDFISDFPEGSIVDCSGIRNLERLGEELSKCRIVLGTSEEGIALAHALGIPAVLFGEKAVDLPIFDSPFVLLEEEPSKISAGQMREAIAAVISKV